MKRPSPKEMKIAFTVVDFYRSQLEKFGTDYKCPDVSRDAEYLMFAQKVLIHAATK